MVKRFILFMLINLLYLPNVFAFEECIISSDAKLTDIKIEYNDIINVYPLITLTNDKKILILQPLKEGKTRLLLSKNNKIPVLLNVTVEADKTTVDGSDEVEILSLDIPEGAYEYVFDLDIPPELRK